MPNMTLSYNRCDSVYKLNYLILKTCHCKTLKKKPVLSFSISSLSTFGVKRRVTLFEAQESSVRLVLRNRGSIVTL